MTETFANWRRTELLGLLSEILRAFFPGLARRTRRGLLSRSTPFCGESWGIKLERLRPFSGLAPPMLERRRLFPATEADADLGVDGGLYFFSSEILRFVGLAGYISSMFILSPKGCEVRRSEEPSSSSAKLPSADALLFDLRKLGSSLLALGRLLLGRMP
jgi:hypothetical protein